jgi:cyclopropane-fatty-acyl-phospholipid synthase
MKWTDRLLRGFLERLVTRGALDVVLPSGEQFSIGDGAAPHAAIRFADAKAVAELLRDPDMKFGELYMEGRLTLVEGDLPTLVGLLFQHGVAMRRDTARRVYDLWRRLRHRLAGANDRFRAHRNVKRHYDLSGEFYGLFLDEDRQYSCATFETPGMSLEDAQRAKRRLLAAKLVMKPGLSVLDIGCGFGGLSLYLADIAEAGSVHGVTLSQTQIAVARERAQVKGLDRVCFDLRDYRDVNGVYDRIVSVGMFEHVGPKHYDAFFRKCADLLAEDGVMLLHTIGHSSTPGVTNPWIVKYIFPGGYLPALSEIVPAVEKAGLLVADVEVLRCHYADTLREWRRRFMARRDEARALYDERFCRMWEFYLTICEAAFRQLDAVVFQIQLTRRNDVVPITRAYIAQAEARLKHAEAALEPQAGELRRFRRAF